MESIYYSLYSSNPSLLPSPTSIQPYIHVDLQKKLLLHPIVGFKKWLSSHLPHSHLYAWGIRVAYEERDVFALLWLMENGYGWEEMATIAEEEERREGLDVDFLLRVYSFRSVPLGDPYLISPLLAEKITEMKTLEDEMCSFEDNIWNVCEVGLATA